MKVFAIVTACLMAGAGLAYYTSSSNCTTCVAPVAQSGVCTETKLDCCTTPCPACASDCQSCCDVCELCCSAGIEGGAATKATKLSGCCEAPPVKLTAAKPVEDEDECCPACKTPVKVATAAALAGIGSK
jgi:hypothetical protein